MCVCMGACANVSTNAALPHPNAPSDRLARLPARSGWGCHAYVLHARSYGDIINDMWFLSPR